MQTCTSRSTSCLLSDPVLDTFGTSMTTLRTASVAKAGTVMVDDRFATMPSLAAVPALTPLPTYRPLDEEELHTSFEQAISDRVLAVKRMLYLNSHAHAVSGLLEQQTAPLAFPTAAPQVEAEQEQTTVIEQPGKKTLVLLHSNPWLRSLAYASLALMFTLVGFDLMGMLALFAR